MLYIQHYIKTVHFWLKYNGFDTVRKTTKLIERGHRGFRTIGILLRFYPRDAMLARVIAIATCPSVCLSVRLSVSLSRAGIVSKRRKLAA